MIRRLILGCWAAVAVGQTAPAPTQVSFRFERPVVGVAVPKYVIAIRQDGTGSYKAEIAGGQPVERELRFDPATVTAAFDGSKLLRESKAPCASKAKNIADTGTKTIESTDTEAVCQFNYSENKGAVQLTEFFQGIEFTLEEGRALDFKHRFDRLGLDAEMIVLGEAAETRKAVGLEVIAPTLRSIAGDTDLIERVRLRAAKLLEAVERRK